MRPRTFRHFFTRFAAQAALGLVTAGLVPAAQAAGTNTITTLASFTGGANGASPSGVTLDSHGNLFGTTATGGDANNDGTVFEIAVGTNTITTLASFNGTNGTNPSGGVTIDSHGNLFGTTAYGGSGPDPGGDGTVFEIAAGTNTIATLANFAGGANGHSLIPSGVTIDSHGNLFGTTAYGGSANAGSVFEIAAGTNTITTLASFTGGTNGDSLVPSGVTIDSHDNLFGTTAYGGDGGDAGSLFEIAAGTNTITTLASFTGGANGASPSGVTLDSHGNLFGTTVSGGDANNDGTVFEIAAGTNTITTLASFTGGANGANPSGVTLDSHGNLFGTTQYGGSGPGYGNGTVWEISPSGHTHLLWNKTDGMAALWTVNPDGAFASAVYGPFSGWTARATAAAPDGTNWLLWTNTNGTASLWNVTSGGYTATQYGPYSGYKAVSLSIGSDGSPHLLWDKADGTALLWTINPANGSFTYTSYGPYAGWTAKAVASGATVTDLLWTNVNGTASGYRIAANGSLTYHFFGPYANYTATALSVGPDDGAHLLWDKTGGTALLWNADFSTGAFTYTSYGPFSGYAARAIATGPDNVTHILWDATNGPASLWNVTGSGYTYTAYGPFSGWTAVAVSAGP